MSKIFISKDVTFHGDKNYYLEPIPCTILDIVDCDISLVSGEKMGQKIIVIIMRLWRTRI